MSDDLIRTFVRQRSEQSIQHARYFVVQSHSVFHHYQENRVFTINRTRMMQLFIKEDRYC